ncbi:hypothetical protein TMES_11550 [Thalassospira mesophila]|uniref:Uncharacterized protein n=1 Tax=Thalassospira mesophila TaxID=1293891 RepID=A0A1Y2L0T4_9PROT|nr:hypothetical protein TMES_11550 [Thalassospira mesophila]
MPKGGMFCRVPITIALGIDYPSNFGANARWARICCDAAYRWARCDKKCADFRVFIRHGGPDLPPAVAVEMPGFTCVRQGLKPGWCS